MAAAPALAGITPEMAEVVAQITTGLLNHHAMPVPAPAQEKTVAQEQTTNTEVAPQPQLQAKPEANVGQDGENVTTRQPEPAQGSQDSSMEELTDGIDSDEDLINANSGEPPARKEKQMTKAATRGCIQDKQGKAGEEVGRDDFNNSSKHAVYSTK